MKPFKNLKAAVQWMRSLQGERHASVLIMRVSGNRIVTEQLWEIHTNSFGAFQLKQVM